MRRRTIAILTLAMLLETLTGTTAGPLTLDKPLNLVPQHRVDNTGCTFEGPEPILTWARGAICFAD